MEHGLRVRKLADTSQGAREARYLVSEDGQSVERVLVNPETGKPEPWPFAGLVIEGKPPKECLLPTSFVLRGQAEGWLTLDNPRMIFRPGGPKEEPWRVTHTFTHADTVILHCVGGDVRYRVIDSPDKWPAEKDGELGFGGQVAWYYRVKLEG